MQPQYAITLRACACAMYCTLCILYCPIHSCGVGRQGLFLDLITCPRSVKECINFLHSRAPVGSKYSPRSCHGKKDKESKEGKRQFSLNSLTCGLGNHILLFFSSHTVTCAHKHKMKVVWWIDMRNLPPVVFL